MTDVAKQALEAAAHWGSLTAPPRLINDRENAVFEVSFNSGHRAALRLHRQGYQSRDFIEAELLWTEGLSQQYAFPCPKPIRTTSGDLTATQSNGRMVSLVSWINAAPIGENGVPFNGPLDSQLKLYERLGKLIRTMHAATDDMDTSNISRPSWGADALLGDTPHWGQFWTNPGLDLTGTKLLQTARENAAQQLEKSKGLDTGLIHADLLQENVLQNADGLHIIDFDDSGTGYRLFDLGTALIQHAEHPHLPELTRALCDGYGCGTDLMPLFIMLRSMASCGWIISRAAANDPRQRFYADRAIRCATAYLYS